MRWKHSARPVFMTTASSILSIVVLFSAFDGSADPAASESRATPSTSAAEATASPPTPPVRARVAAPVKKRRPPTRRPSRRRVRRAPLRKNGFQWPARARLTSVFGPRWGSFHHGIDIACSKGTPIKPTRPGRVISAGWAPIYGRMVVVRHRNGYRSLYAHMRRIKVREGQWAKYGTTLGTCGRSGASTGVHLHFEIYKKGKVRNPLRYMPPLRLRS